MALDAVDLLRHEDGRVSTPLEANALTNDAPIPTEQFRGAVGAVISELLQNAAEDEIDDTAFDTDLDDQLDAHDLAPPGATAVAALPLLGAAACGEEVSAEVLAAANELADTGALLPDLPPGRWRQVGGRRPEATHSTEARTRLSGLRDRSAIC